MSSDLIALAILVTLVGFCKWPGWPRLPSTQPLSESCQVPVLAVSGDASAGGLRYIDSPSQHTMSFLGSFTLVRSSSFKSEERRGNSELAIAVMVTACSRFDVVEYTRLKEIWLLEIWPASANANRPRYKSIRYRKAMYKTELYQESVGTVSYK